MWKRVFIPLFVLSYLVSNKAISQINLTPLIGVEVTTLNENYDSYSRLWYDEPFLGVPIFRFAIGVDVEKPINKKTDLFYGFSFQSFETGKRYYYSSWTIAPYNNFKFKNFQQNLGLIYHLTGDIGLGLAINLDYVTDFELETVYRSMPFPYASLLFLGANLNVRYIWRNFVIKVDYKRGFFDLNNGNKKVVNGTRNPLYPQKGFGFYLGYRFSL